MTPEPATEGGRSPSLVQWNDAQDLSADTELRDENRRRREFFDAASEHTAALMAVDADDTIVLVSARDRAFGRTLFSKRYSTPSRLLRRAQQVLKRNGLATADVGATFVDVGAGTGLATLAAVGQLGFTDGIALESDPGVVRMLRANLVLNDLSAVQVIHGQAETGVPVAYRRRGAWNDWRPIESSEEEEAARRKGHAVATVPSETIDRLYADGLLRDSSFGIVWVSSALDPTAILEHATRLDTAKLPLVIEFSNDLYHDDAYERLGAVVGERFRSVVDLSLNPRDVILADAANLGSVTERYVHARGTPGTHLLLLGAP